MAWIQQGAGFKCQKNRAVLMRQPFHYVCMESGGYMRFRKNDVTELVIEDISISGEGIGKADGYTLFVRDAVPGDRVEVQITKAKSRYGYARIRRILEPSGDRIEPACPVAGPCGGCQL